MSAVLILPLDSLEPLAGARQRLADCGPAVGESEHSFRQHQTGSLHHFLLPSFTTLAVNTHTCMHAGKKSEEMHHHRVLLLVSLLALSSHELRQKEGTSERMDVMSNFALECRAIHPSFSLSGRRRCVQQEECLLSESMATTPFLLLLLRSLAAAILSPNTKAIAVSIVLHPRASHIAVPVDPSRFSLFPG